MPLDRSAALVLAVINCIYCRCTGTRQIWQIWLQIWPEPDLAGSLKNGQIPYLLELKSGTSLVSTTTEACQLYWMLATTVLSLGFTITTGITGQKNAAGASCVFCYLTVQFNGLLTTQSQSKKSQHSTCSEAMQCPWLTLVREGSGQVWQNRCIVKYRQTLTDRRSDRRTSSSG